MPDYYFTKDAVKDLTQVWDYTFEIWSEQQANKYYGSIIAACQQLAINPQKGKKFTKVRHDLLGYPVGKHIIFYRIMSPTIVEIARILHQKMDYRRRMR